MKRAMITIALLLITMPIAAASSKTYTPEDDPTFKLKLTSTPTKIVSKPGYVPAFQDRNRMQIPRRFLSSSQALTEAYSGTTAKNEYITGPRIDVASVSKLALVKPKYAPREDRPSKSSVSTIGTFGAKLSPTAAFPKRSTRAY